MKLRIQRDQHKKWILAIIFALIGFTIGYLGPDSISTLSRAKYNRNKLEAIMREYLGHSNFSQLLTDETIVVAYDYNS